MEAGERRFWPTRDAEVYLSQPGLGTVLAARVLGEFGDDPDRYAGAKARKNYAGTSPITRASGKKKTVLARYARNGRLADALHQQAYCALTASPGARAYTTLRRGQATTPPCASSPTASSASSTAASRPAPSTTNTPPGPTTATSRRLTT